MIKLSILIFIAGCLAGCDVNVNVHDQRVNPAVIDENNRNIAKAIEALTEKQVQMYVALKAKGINILEATPTPTPNGKN